VDTHKVHQNLLSLRNSRWFRFIVWFFIFLGLMAVFRLNFIVSAILAIVITWLIVKLMNKTDHDKYDEERRRRADEEYRQRGVASGEQSRVGAFMRERADQQAREVEEKARLAAEQEAKRAEMLNSQASSSSEPKIMDDREKDAQIERARQELRAKQDQIEAECAARWNRDALKDTHD